MTAKVTPLEALAALLPMLPEAAWAQASAWLAPGGTRKVEGLIRLARATLAARLGPKHPDALRAGKLLQVGDGGLEALQRAGERAAAILVMLKGIDDGGAAEAWQKGIDAEADRYEAWAAAAKRTIDGMAWWDANMGAAFDAQAATRSLEAFRRQLGREAGRLRSLKPARPGRRVVRSSEARRVLKACGLTDKQSAELVHSLTKVRTIRKPARR